MNNISDYSEQDFIDFIKKILIENVAETDDLLDEMLVKFEEITEHPDGTDLIYYPENPADSTPERITEIVKEWRESKGLPSFKEV